MRTPRLTFTMLLTAAALAGGATPALAAKPIAATDAADGITPVGATLHGTVNPRGLASSAFFQLGTTKKYSRRTADQSAGVTAGNIPVAVGVSGLKSSTTYHYRVVSENKDGRTNGEDRTFKTAAPTTTPVFTPNPVPYGDSVFVSGTIIGSGAKGAEVTLFGHPFPFTDPFTQFGNTVVADANGSYLFTLASALSTSQYEVRAKTDPAFTSSVQLLQVSSKISLAVTDKLRKGQRARFHGLVAPGQDGIVVEIQKRRRDGSFGTFVNTTLKHRTDGLSSYSVRKKLYKRGIFRAVVHSAGGAVVEGTSPRDHSVAVTKAKKKRHKKHH
jgi:hypothetical protein